MFDPDFRRAKMHQQLDSLGKFVLERDAMEGRHRVVNVGHSGMTNVQDTTSRVSGRKCQLTRFGATNFQNIEPPLTRLRPGTERIARDVEKGRDD